MTFFLSSVLTYSSYSVSKAGSISQAGKCDTMCRSSRAESTVVWCNKTEGHKRNRVKVNQSFTTNSTRAQTHVCHRTCHLPCVRFKGITLSLRAQSRLCLSTIENDHWEAVFFPITPSRAIVETFSLSFPILLMWCRAILGMMIFRGFHSFYCFHMWSYL